MTEYHWCREPNQEIATSGKRRRDGSSHQQHCRVSIQGNLCEVTAYLVHVLYPVSKPFPISACSNAHQPAKRDSLRPPRPFDFPCAAMAAMRSKKSKIICVRASDSTLIGIKVAKASLASWESGHISRLSKDRYRTFPHLALQP